MFHTAHVGLKRLFEDTFALIGMVAVVMVVTEIGKAKGKEWQHLLQEEGHADVEEVRVSKMVGLSQQGAWTRWENTL